MRFNRLKRLTWALRTDAEFRRLGWRCGTFLSAYYRGRLQDHLPDHSTPVVRRFVVRHGVSDRKATLCIRLDPGGGDWIVLRGIWLHQDYFHSLIGQCRTILDVGANVGMAAVWFKLLNPEVHIACVEPDPRNVPLLRDNLAANGIEAQVFECAVAPRTGRARLGIGIDTGWSSLEQCGLHTHTTFIEVDAQHIPAILDKLGWSQVDLLKLDVEGLERDLLADASEWLSRVGYIVLEVHRNTSSGEIADLLRPYGWALERIGHQAEETYLARPYGQDI